MLGEIKVDLNKYSLIERFNSVKLFIIHVVIYRFSKIAEKLTAGYFEAIGKMTKFYMEIQRMKNRQNDHEK